MRSWVEECEREGLVRVYADTGATTPVASYRDDKGVLRYHGRRRFVREATFSGGTPRLPPHLVCAREAMRVASTVAELADVCGVRESTAWSYLSLLAERDERLREECLAFVHAPLIDAYLRVDGTGSLREVMDRITPLIGAEPEWRETRDRYAHLRLVRLCLP